MTRREQSAALPHSLRRLRLRLTAWYVGTFFVILALLGIGMFATITRRFDRDLDASLREASRELIRVVSHRAHDVSAASARLFDLTNDLRIPDRTLLLVDSAGRSIGGPAADAWLQAMARDALGRGAADRIQIAGDRILRAHAERFVANGRPLVAIAVADEIELEDRYASLIAAFGASAIVALVLVAAGGWLLARQSTAPVERTIDHMRRFMADAAHELRTPLTVVRSRAEVALQRPREAAGYVEALHAIERETERLGRIVEDLLMLARADAGERPVERQRVFLDDVALDAAEAARAIADRRFVRLEVDRFEEAAIDADPSLVRQLVMILLDNAIKFTPANGVVRIGVEATSSMATLAVTDTGIGIPSDQLPQVFERFYRGDPARTRVDAPDGAASEGAGLGLSIARWIADEHGAALTIESQSGQGTRVVVQFPAAHPRPMSS